MCPRYITGLIDPGYRKSVQPMAARFVAGEYDRLHHFIAAGLWEKAPLEAELLAHADRLVGGDDAELVIDDKALPNKGSHWVGGTAIRVSPWQECERLDIGLRDAGTA